MGSRPCPRVLRRPERTDRDVTVRPRRAGPGLGWPARSRRWLHGFREIGGADRLACLDRALLQPRQGALRPHRLQGWLDIRPPAGTAPHARAPDRFGSRCDDTGSRGDRCRATAPRGAIACTRVPRPGYVGARPRGRPLLGPRGPCPHHRRHRRVPFPRAGSSFLDGGPAAARRPGAQPGSPPHRGNAAPVGGRECADARQHGHPPVPALRERRRFDRHPRGRTGRLAAPGSRARYPRRRRRHPVGLHG